MSQRMIQRCDACGVEVEEDDSGAPRGAIPVRTLLGPLVGPMRSKFEDWGRFMITGTGLPASFDLCASCVDKALQTLDMKRPEAPHVELHGFQQPAIRQTPGLKIVGGGALTEKDLQELGLMNTGDDDDVDPRIEIAPGVNLATATFTCPKCSTTRDCQSFNPICIACGYQDPDPKFNL